MTGPDEAMLENTEKQAMMCDHFIGLAIPNFLSALLCSVHFTLLHLLSFYFFIQNPETSMDVVVAVVFPYACIYMIHVNNSQLV